MLQHALVHLSVDFFLGWFLSRNDVIPVLVQSLFITFVSTCLNPEDFFYYKLVIGIFFLFLVMFQDFQYHEAFLGMDTCHDMGHVAVHFLSSCLIEFYFGWDKFLIDPMSSIHEFIGIAILYTLIHTLWEGKQRIRVCIVFVVLIHLVVFLYFGAVLKVVVHESLKA